MEDLVENGKVNLSVKGMTCNHCASTVNGIIQQEGGKEIHVDYLMGEASFDLNNPQKMERILKRLGDAGYESKAEQEQSENTQTGLSSIEKKFLFTLPFSLVLMAHMVVPHDWWLNNIWVQFALCLPVFGMGLFHFGKSTWEGIKSKTINMDLLILLGSSSAFFYSFYGAIFHGDSPNIHNFLFFETTSTIISLVLLGYVIEHRAVQKTTTVLRELFKSKPEKAKKLVKNGLNQDLIVVKASDLAADDIVLINAGDRVPADGVIIHGEVQLDEAMLTGESEAIFKKKGDHVFSGSIMVEGSCTVKVEKTGSESTIGQIIDLIKQSRADKPAVQKMADKISSVFVPAIIGIAALTFIINYFFAEAGISEAIIRSVAVLVIACPCAMGLATPTAVSVGLGLAGKIGIIIKKASSFEELNAVQQFIFDKTGTLTEGKLKLVLNELSEGTDQEEVWKILKALEERSSHPIAQAVLNVTEHLSAANLDQIEEVKGKGMQANYNGKVIKFGTSAFTGQSNANADLYLMQGNVLIANFSVSDQLKPEAKASISFIQKLEKSISILSGDNQKKTESVAKELAIKDFHAHKLPNEKLEFIQKAKDKNLVAMIGDGINDSPSLAAAHVGISMGTANALAAESAKIVILGSSLKQVVMLLKISKNVVKTIKQNLFWAFAYNLVAIPLAAMGYLDPMVAALSMAFSDVIVIGNSLRLRLILPKKIH
jgi:P-type Cu+ transporter